MNGLPYYKAYPRDFIEGTIGMPFELKAAYRLVLDLIYMQGGELPDDARYISGLLGCSTRAWKSYREALISAGKIAAENGIISNFRARKELENSAKLQRTQSENRRGSRKNNDLQKPPSIHTDTELYIEGTDVPSNTSATAKPKTPTPRSELEAVLDPERAKAVIDHRQRIRKPLTAHAARLLAGKFAQVASPNAAADAMIANGWQGFEPGWLEGRSDRQQRGPPQKPWKPRNAGEWALQNLGMIDEHGNSTGKLDRRDDPGDANGFEAGDGSPVLLAFPGRGGS